MTGSYNTPSSSLSVFKYFANKLIFQVCSFVENFISFDPGETTLIVVKSWEYPAPGSATFTDVITPSVKTGVRDAPDPFPSTIISGGEV